MKSGYPISVLCSVTPIQDCITPTPPNTCLLLKILPVVLEGSKCALRAVKPFPCPTRCNLPVHTRLTLPVISANANLSPSVRIIAEGTRSTAQNPSLCAVMFHRMGAADSFLQCS